MGNTTVRRSNAWQTNERNGGLHGTETVGSLFRRKRGRGCRGDCPHVVKEMIQSMFGLGISLDQIAQIADMSAEEVEQMMKI